MSTVTLVAVGITAGAKASVASVLLISHITTTMSTVTLVSVGIIESAKVSVTSVLLMSHTTITMSTVIPHVD